MISCNVIPIIPLSLKEFVTSYFFMVEIWMEIPKLKRIKKNERKSFLKEH